MNLLIKNNLSIFSRFLMIAGLFFSISSFAENLICFGGIHQKPYISSVELTPELRTEIIWAGTLPTAAGQFEFTVQHLGVQYFYQVQNLNSGEIVLHEIVPTLPAVRTVPLDNSHSLFIDCKPYSLIEYCRTHTC